MLNIKNRPHRRYNVLNGEWVLVSPHRMQRPWIGAQETVPMDKLPVYDPDCYLCPGNIRANGEQNPQYQDVYVFPNDFAALLPDSMPKIPNMTNVFNKIEGVQGDCRVVCFSPRHDLTLTEMTAKEINTLVGVWSAQVEELRRLYRWVQIFENKGSIMGCSNPHPHGQIWAGSALPVEPQKEYFQQLKYFKEHNSNLLLDYIQFEMREEERIVVQNQHWVALVPFWAIWPYEILLLPKHHVLHLPDLSSDEKFSLAEIMRIMLIKYDNLFETSLPYTMGWHGEHGKPGKHPYWQLHAHFYPPLLRSAGVKKFMVGYEMLAEAQRDLTAELAAEKLRSLSEIRFNKIN